MTPEERAWLDENPAITLSISIGTPPRSYLDADGQITGFNADFVRLIEQRTGLQINLLGSSWPVALKRAFDYEVDGVMNAAEVEERKRYLKFTEVYFHTPQAVLASKNEQPISDLNALCGRKVAVKRNSSHMRHLQQHFSCIQLIELDGPELILTYLASGKVDAAFDNYDTLVGQMQRMALVGFKSIFLKYLPPAGFSRIGVRKDNPILHSILDKAVRSITDEERNRISTKWIGGVMPPLSSNFNRDVKLSFTKEEQAWLESHSIVRAVLNPDWAPIEFRNEEGHFQGISVEYLNRMEELLNIKFEILQNISWDEGVVKLQDKQADMFFSMQRTAERENFALFTEPYTYMSFKIYSRSDVSYVGGLRNLAGKRVSVAGGYGISEKLSRDYPDIQQGPNVSLSEAFEMLTTGDLDAFIGNEVTASYFLSRSRITNIRVAGETPYRYHQSMSVRDDWPIFVGILQKALNSIEQMESDAFYNRWMMIRYDIQPNYSLLWKILPVVVVLMIIFFFWNRRLAHEIANRKRAQESLKQAMFKAENANKAKSEFLSSMSHELRTPMTGIIGFTDILLDDDIPEESKIKVHRIKRATSFLLTIINDILDLSKLDASKLEIEMIDFDPRLLIEEVMEIFHAKRKTDENLVIEIDFSNDFPMSVRSDPTRMRQILLNLIGNAIKFTAKGYISIKGTMCKVVGGGDFVKLSITDTGIGIEKDTQAKLFSDFTQADASISRKYMGTGLGLAICKRLVDLIGGKIGVESKLGEGSTFWFTLPYIAATSDVSHENHVTPVTVYSTASPLNILIAEDNRTNQLIIGKIMEKYGHQTEIVENGALAVEANTKGNFDLILMDVRMPEMDGLEATRMIRASQNKANIPIIALTADAMVENKKRYFEVGMNECVAKPFNTPDLLETINKVMGKEIHVRQT